MPIEAARRHVHISSNKLYPCRMTHLFFATANQITGTLGAGATMNPTNVQCQNEDRPNNVAFPSCMTIDASTQVDCTGSPTPYSALSCIAIDASQVGS